MIQPHVDKKIIQGKMHQKITHDLVLDVYEAGVAEPDPEKREAIIATAKVLSESIGDYLVQTEKDEENS